MGVELPQPLPDGLPLLLLRVALESRRVRPRVRALHRRVVRLPDRLELLEEDVVVLDLPDLLPAQPRERRADKNVLDSAPLRQEEDLPRELQQRRARGVGVRPRPDNHTVRGELDEELAQPRPERLGRWLRRRGDVDEREEVADAAVDVLRLVRGGVGRHDVVEPPEEGEVPLCGAERSGVQLTKESCKRHWRKQLVT